MNIHNYKGHCFSVGLFMIATIMYNPHQPFEPVLLCTLLYVGISILITGSCVQDAIRCGSKEVSEAINNRMDKTNSIIPEVSRTSTD